MAATHGIFSMEADIGTEEWVSVKITSGLNERMICIQLQSPESIYDSSTQPNATSNNLNESRFDPL